MTQRTTTAGNGYWTVIVDRDPEYDETFAFRFRDGGTRGVLVPKGTGTIELELDWNFGTTGRSVAGGVEATDHLDDSYTQAAFIAGGSSEGAGLPAGESAFSVTYGC